MADPQDRTEPTVRPGKSQPQVMGCTPVNDLTAKVQCAPVPICDSTPVKLGTLVSDEGLFVYQGVLRCVWVNADRATRQL